MRWIKWNKTARRWVIVLATIGIVLISFERCREYNEHSQDQNIAAAAQRYGVAPSLVKAIVWRESRFNPHAHGRAGEIGLMQIRDAAANEWAQAEKLPLFSHSDLYDPAKNTMAGTWYLRKLLRRYGNTDNPPAYALADYNAGRTHVLRWNKGAASTNSTVFLKQMDFGGTRDYVNAILKREARYRKQFSGS
jgi:soluble lytic murein transglycosylase